MMDQIPPVHSLFNLHGKVVAITGSGSGMGGRIAQRFAEAGADVVLHYHHSAEGAQKTADAICSTGNQVLVLQADLSQAGQVEQFIRQIFQRFGRLDVLVNNAGIYPVTPLVDLQPDEWQHVIDANLTSAYLCTRLAVREMIARTQIGSIVNIASIEAINPAPGHAHYCAAKAGLVMFTRSVAPELGKHGIRINCISPGLINKPGLAQSWPDGVNRWMEAVPLQRLGEPEDVADACLFFASPASRWITGAELVVDGGILSCQVY
jgi:NAD(P)-dependent dehydrogenase (short-subunit alcohol dehydrogenase family)